MVKIQYKHKVCGEELSTPIHVCAFFDSREEQYDVILPYILEGLNKNEKIINILEQACHHDHYERLGNFEIDVEEKSKTKQLHTLASEDTYLKDGYFEAEKMLNLLEDALIEANDEGFESVRACGEMVWALTNMPGTDELIEYEARLNLLVPKHNCSLICMYDVNRFSGRVLKDVLATHSHVIMNGSIYKNPYYIEPLKFLPNLLRKKQSSLLP